MTAKNFFARIKRILKGRDDVTVKIYKLRYKAGTYDFWVVRSRTIGPKDRVIFIRAGIHGNEIAGPMSMLRYLEEMIDYIHDAGLKCVIIPLANPLGFEMCRRYAEMLPSFHKRDVIYSILRDGTIRSDACGNGDCIRYEMNDGTFRDDLYGMRGQRYKGIFWSDRGPRGRKWEIRLPEETKLNIRLFRRMIEHDFKGQIIAAVDCHQDNFRKKRAGAYHYAFGKTNKYRHIIEAIRRLGVPIIVHRRIGDGYACSRGMRTNRYGFIIRHDGSLTDAADRKGIRHAITVETTKKTPSLRAQRVNLIWICGIVDIERIN